MKEIKLKIHGYENRRNLCLAFADSGYKVKVDPLKQHNKATEFVITVEIPENDIF